MIKLEYKCKGGTKMKNYPFVTIVTCVYNGAHTMQRVFNSLKNLDYPNFEHLIIDDGSTDNLEELVEKYKAEVDFPVRYYKKENGGKHTALNMAWDLAQGELIAGVDADDEILPQSIKFLVDTYLSIPDDIRDQYWCVHGRCVTQYGDFVGDKYPQDINDRPWREAGKIATTCKGEKYGIKVKKHLDGYRFPEVNGLTHVPEGVIWGRINKCYGTWYTNEVVRVYYVNEGNNLTAVKKKRKQFASTAYWYKWQMMYSNVYGISIKKILYYSLSYFISHKEYRENNKYLDGVKKYALPLVLISPIMYVAAFLFRKIKKIK